MELSDFLTFAISWLSFDALADCLCILLVLAVFAIARNLFKQSR